jgi:hypothetical protein
MPVVFPHVIAARRRQAFGMLTDTTVRLAWMTRPALCQYGQRPLTRTARCASRAGGTETIRSTSR